MQVALQHMIHETLKRMKLMLSCYVKVTDIMDVENLLKKAQARKEQSQDKTEIMSAVSSKRMEMWIPNICKLIQQWNVIRVLDVKT